MGKSVATGWRARRGRIDFGIRAGRVVGYVQRPFLPGDWAE